MITSTDNIVIVGGGSAGWMTAAAIIKQFPNKKITVIESVEVPKIGVGESTLGHFKLFCRFLGINEVDFMRSTDAVYKLSIQFTDFYQKDYGSFHYPFGHPCLKQTVDGLQDWFFKKYFYPETPIDDFVKCYFPAEPLWRLNKISFNKNGEFDNFNSDSDISYQIDAVKFARWLSEKYCIPRGVKHVQATVTDIKLNEDIGIEKLILNTGDEITSDIFIDCTGFRSLLIGDALKQKFLNYNHILTNNRAWAAQVPYKNKEQELQGFTNCTAIENGWVWNTPVWTRLGTGYVYSDKFVDPEIAKEEFKRYLMSDKMVIPRSRDDVDSLSFRDIPMRIGTYKNIFVKNVVAIGLSAGFIEPLESNGLLTIHEWALDLLRLLRKPAINGFDIEMFNQSKFKHWEGFAEFVYMHYAMSLRSDTEYWRNNFKLNNFENFVIADSHKNFLREFYSSNKFDNPLNGINYISVGLNNFVLDEIIADKKLIYTKEKFRTQYMNSFKNFESKKFKWEAYAKKAPSLFDYLRKNIYDEV